MRARQTRIPIEAPSGAAGTASLTGTIERVTFHSEDTGFTVCKLAVPGRNDLVTVVGTFQNPVIGESVECDGRWTSHKDYGQQFSVDSYRLVRPSTVFAIERYLGSGLIHGVGQVMAKRLVARFGVDTLDVIENEPDRLTEVEGVGAARAESILSAWAEQREIRELMLFLQEYEVSPALAVRIFRQYGTSSISVVTRNPFVLARDIRGIGFKTADTIARKMGMPPDSPDRIAAGLLYTLSEATNDGHLFLPEPKLAMDAAALLGLEVAAVSPPLRDLIDRNEVVVSAIGRVDGALRAVYHPLLFAAETSLAAEFGRRLLEAPTRTISREKLDAWLARQTARMGIELSAEQHDAVALTLQHPITIITGGPGTGKTTVTNLVAAALEAQHKKVVLLSPTGRAARRLQEVTHRHAQTIHMALKFDPATFGFLRDEEHPIACDAVIVDEVSMLDTELATSLMKAIPRTAQIVLVGDADQLPSVGPGNVLADLLSCGRIASVQLTHVFRQAARSLIVTNAHRVRQGEFPVLVAPRDRAENNCVWVEVDEAEEGPEQVVALARTSLPNLGFAREEIQVLSAMHRGDLGVAHLNAQLQQALNPPASDRLELGLGTRTFRAGDRVIQTVNNYDKGVFNGDIGTIVGIDAERRSLSVQFNDRPVEYLFADCGDLQLAYALSIHKSQGSEYPAVILVIHSSHYVMLQRNLLYTGLTRARKLCVLVGNKRAISRAVRNADVTERFTMLAERVRRYPEMVGVG
ncbi:MAG: ATP-dependent RecD-like DNA helicase [Armatimonadetes bacterium]|nr:ATP-dependent RecD-like DNA helicase [Armatimonadota bacterium]MDE2205872.1 ATP-dependent RecD-like DNA helicase [Armatimonadota bacterium]